ncbi:MAG: hypothetical protein E7416_01355 [Ruminococcaceae bacterium]|nr:hypothetical protein [Oscillospiraceae bacterium]
MKKIFLIFILILCISANTVSFAEDSAPTLGQRIAKEAALWLGTPYGYSDGAEGYGSPVDCSGLVMRVYEAFGIELPRSSSLQAAEGERVDLNNMIAGDIVCFMYEDGTIGHVGIYIGDNVMIHSPRSDKFVEFSRNFEDWGFAKAVYGRRIIAESDYIPREPDEVILSELNRLFAKSNSVKTNHLKDLIIPDISAQVPEVLPDWYKTVVLQIGNPLMTVDNTEKYIDPDGVAAPCIINNRTHLPLRNVAEEFGVTVEWIGGDTKEIRLSANGVVINLYVDSPVAIANGVTKYVDCVPIIIEEKTYIPIKFIADEFGWIITWDGENKKISLSGYPSEI